MNTKTAILIFAQSANEELKHKAIYKGKRLFKNLNEQILTTVKSTGLPYFLYTEAQQYGATFAERFTNAVSEVYAKGYDAVITIGNDSPQLQKKHLLQAQKSLLQKNFVLGPSTDGGFYLMGLRKSLFNREVFLKLPWQTNRLNNSLLAYIKTKEVAVTTLSTLFDIDTVNDLKAIINHSFLLPEKVRMLLREIVHQNNVKKQWFCFVDFCKTLYLFISYNKGSPVFSS